MRDLADPPVPEDLLGIAADAALLADFLVSPKLSLPFSVGIHGRSGSGQTAFARWVRLYAKRSASGVPGHQLAQVEFSAATDLDSFPELTLLEVVYRALDDREHAFEELGGTARLLREQARAEVDRAAAALDAVKAQLSDAEREYGIAVLQRAEVSAAQKWQGVTAIWQREASDETRQRLERAGAILGLDRLEERPEDWSNVLEQAGETSGLATLIAASVTARRWVGNLILSFVVGASLLIFLCVGYLLARNSASPADWAEQMAKLLGLATTLIGGAVAVSIVYMRNEARAALNVLRAHRDELRRVERDWQAKHEFALVSAEDALALRRDDVARLREQLTSALQEFAKARDTRHSFLKPGILRRIVEHYRSLLLDAENQRGVRGLIRADLRALTEYFAEHRSIGRIILYIDDLDKCAPADAFGLLRAIRLFLSTPLFATVLVVDPRWLESLIRRSFQPLAGHEPLAGDDLALPTREFVSRLVNLHFWLEPLRRGELWALVRAELDATPVTYPQPLLADAAVAEAPTDTEPLAQPAEPDASSFTLTHAQIDAAGRLASAFKTPRLVKRYVTTLRFAWQRLNQSRRFPGDEAFLSLAFELMIVLAAPELVARFSFLLEDRADVRSLRQELEADEAWLSSPCASVEFHPELTTEMLRATWWCALTHAFTPPHIQPA